MVLEVISDHLCTSGLVWMLLVSPAFFQLSLFLVESDDSNAVSLNVVIHLCSYNTLALWKSLGG